MTHETYTMETGDLTENFHVYGLIWNQNTIQTYIDNPNNIVLNVSIGDQSFWQTGNHGNHIGPIF